MKKSNKKGFTLVELVVVIAIIGVLAAILVPSMMGYVKKSRLKSANSNAKLVFTTVNNQAADIIAEGGSVADGAVSPVAVSSLAAADKLQTAVKDALSDNGNGAGYVSWKIETGKVKFAQWCSEATNNKILGQYPNPATDVDDSAMTGATFGTQFTPAS